MGKSLSLDIRERVVALVEEGLSCHEAARRLMPTSRPNLAPTLKPGDVVVADNLSPHKSAYAQNLLAQGIWRLFLPP